MRARAGLVVALACSLGSGPSPAAARPAAPSAPAAVLDIGPAHVVVADGWTPFDVAAPSLREEPAAQGARYARTHTVSETAVQVFAPIVLRAGGGAVMIVTRAPAPNLVAWSKATRDAHVDELIDGFTAVDGATVLRRVVTSEGEAGVPVLDLTLLRGARVVAIRVILFRTLTVAAAATADDRSPATRAALERAVAGLHPDR